MLPTFPSQTRRPFGPVLARLLLVIGSAAAATGCGDDGLPRQAVSGLVSLDDQPLPQGDIQFFPMEQGVHAVASGAPIRNGRYEIPRDQGLTPGRYKVMISAAGEPPSAAKGKRKAPAAEEVGDMPGLGPLNNEELIPAKYNAKTELTATVTLDGPNRFDFPLKR